MRAIQSNQSCLQRWNDNRGVAARELLRLGRCVILGPGRMKTDLVSFCAGVLFSTMLFQANAFGDARPYGLETRPKAGPFLDNHMPEAVPLVSGNWATAPVFTNLLFTNALGLTFVPETRILVVWEREGRVYSFENSPG